MAAVSIAGVSMAALLSACSGDASNATDADAAARTSVSASAVAPTSVPESTVPEEAAPQPSESTFEPPRQTVPILPVPEEVSDLIQWNPPRPSIDSVNVDSGLFETGVEQYNFVSPTGNVHCGIWGLPGPEGHVGCQAVDSVNPFQGRHCSNAENDKFAVRVTDTGSDHLCTTQGIYVAQNAKVLEYGQLLSAANALCYSDAVTGITCWGNGGGFTFSRDINSTF